MTLSLRYVLPAAVILAATAWSPPARGQGEDRPLEDLTLLQLADRAEEAYDRDPASSVPVLLEIRERLRDAKSSDFREVLRETIFRLGRIEMESYIRAGNEEALRRANTYWTEFLGDFGLDPRARLALLNRADGWFALGEHEKAIADYRRLLGDDFRQRLLDDERINVHERLARSLRALERWEEAEPHLFALLELETAPPVRSFAANALLDGFLKAGSLEDLVRIVPLLRRDPLFRFDYGINVRLLQAGDDFADREEYLKASFLYSLVLPLAEIVRRVEDRLVEVEEILFTRSFRPPEEPALREERSNLLERRADLREAGDYTADLKWRQALVLRKMGRRFEAFFAFRRLMEDHADHERIEQFHYTAFRQARDCDYRADAIRLAEDYLANPSYLAYEKPVHAQLGFLYLSAGRIDDLARLTDGFLHRFPEDPVAAQLTHLLGAGWFREGNVDRVLRAFPRWLQEYPRGAFRPGARYWTGMAKVMEGRFGEAREDFEAILADFPGSVYATEARFRIAVCDFGRGDYGNAEKRFDGWTAEFPDHPLRPEAEAFLGDLAAMDARVAEALEHYRSVEETGGSGRLIDHSYFEAARLLEANDRLDDMREWLERYLARHGNRPEAAEAVLRLARADFAEGFVSAGFERYRSAVEAFGNRSESDAVDRVLDAWWTRYREFRDRLEADRGFLRNLLEDAVFRDRLLRDRLFALRWFREHPAVSDGLREMVSGKGETREALLAATPEEPETKGALLSLSDFPALAEVLEARRRAWEQAPAAAPAEEFAAMRRAALDEDRLTLALRLERVMAERGDRKREPVEFSGEEIRAASPATLVWMAALLSGPDPERASALYRTVIEDHPESAAAVEALYRRGKDRLGEGAPLRALEDFRKILSEFAENRWTVPATFGLADAQFAAGRYDEAIETLSGVLERREWRGEPWARATYGIGRAFFEKGELEKAQGFFERTYLAYGRFEPWSGRAYRESGRVLERLGETESARRTYEAFLDLPEAESSPVFGEIRERLADLETGGAS